MASILQTAAPTMDSPQLSPSVSPNRSRASSRGSHLTLDLSALPPLSQPATPSNTLLITNLANPEIFSAPHLQELREIINASAPIASWSPLKSFRRIVCSFSSTEDAITVRSAMDGEAVLGDRVRVYFGEHTPLEPVDQHLQAPESKKLFFISPPPSPPHGWELKNEEPPNAVVVAEDLVHALARLSTKRKPTLDTSMMMTNNTASSQDGNSGGTSPGGLGIRRPRSSSSVVLFEPEDDDKAIPAISVDDYTDSETEVSPISSPLDPTLPPSCGTAFHTSRPPVELMNGDALN